MMHRVEFGKLMWLKLGNDAALQKVYMLPWARTAALPPFELSMGAP